MSWKKTLEGMRQQLQTPEIGEIMSETAKRVRMEGRDVINLGPGLPDFQLPDHVYDDVRNALDNRSLPIHGAPAAGLPSLREAISEKLRSEDDVEFEPESEITVTNGAFHAFSVIVQAAAEPGDEIIMTRPGFYFHEPIIIGRAIPVLVDIRKDSNWQVHAEDVESKITSRTKVLLLNTPHNPTGHVMRKNELEEIAEVAKKHDLLVVQDSVYDRFVYDGLRHYNIAALPGMKERTIVMNSFSKGYCMYNWRVGYLACDKSIMKVLRKVLGRTVITVNYLAQVAASSALRGPQGWIHNMVKEFENRRNLLVARLNSIGFACTKPDGTIVVLTDITRFDSDSVRFAKHLLERTGVQAQPGAMYLAEGQLRVSLGERRQRIEEAVERIGRIMSVEAPSDSCS